MQVTVNLSPYIITWLQHEAEAYAKDSCNADRVRGIEPAPQEPRCIEQETALQIERAYQAALARGYKPAADAEEIPF